MTTSVRLLLALSIAVMSLIVVGGALNARNFCFARQEFMSGEELLASTIAQIPQLTHLTQDRGKAILGSLDKSSDLSQVAVLNYDNASDFLKHNPNCCRIGRFDGPREPLFAPDLWTVLSGYATKIVTINFNIRYLRPDGQEVAVADPFYVWIDACGKIKPYR